jgi:hypothetical protein
VFDRPPDQRGARSDTTELGTSLTSWWHSEIEFGFDRDPGAGQPLLLTQAVWENMFQITETGEPFLDAGIFFEYAGPNENTFGPYSPRKSAGCLARHRRPRMARCAGGWNARFHSDRQAISRSGMERDQCLRHRWSGGRIRSKRHGGGHVRCSRREGHVEHIRDGQVLRVGCHDLKPDRSAR